MARLSDWIDFPDEPFALPVAQVVLSLCSTRTVRLTDLAHEVTLSIPLLRFTRETVFNLVSQEVWMEILIELQRRDLVSVGPIALRTSVLGLRSHAVFPSEPGWPDLSYPIFFEPAALLDRVVLSRTYGLPFWRDFLVSRMLLRFCCSSLPAAISVVSEHHFDVSASDNRIFTTQVYSMARSDLLAFSEYAIGQWRDARGTDLDCGFSRSAITTLQLCLPFTRGSFSDWALECSRYSPDYW
jgi:hypothetical protein